MEVVLEKRIAPVAGRPEIAKAGRPARLEIAVVFTSVDSTLAALKHASVLADRLDGRITLLVLQAVPHPLPLSSPPVLIDWNERRCRAVADASPVETTVRVYLCRKRYETLQQALGHRALVVIGGPRRWWRFTAERNLARKLRRAGHEVVLIETE
jgi:hypothetical protein